TGPTRVGAPDDRQGAERAVLVARGWHERQRVPLSGAARPQRGAATTDRGAGAAPQALRRGDDPPEASAGGRRAGELQACGAAVSGGATAGTPAQAEEGTGERAPTTVSSI